MPVRAVELTPQQQEDIATMLQLADKAQLAQRVEWRKINLYHPVFGKLTSRIDDPTYFLSPQGKADPQAELEATIRGAFDEEMAAQSRQTNVCRHIARYQFLSRSFKELGFNYASPKCQGFEQWKSGIATHQATLIFASIYLNSPASMYGHSFIRFDSEKAGEYNRLNDATIGYSVGAGQEAGAMFIVRSLFGGYPGTFVSVPFYMKLREYSDLENRDLWEYRTNFREAEIERMLAFIWEQSFTYLDYFFFDDNCALMLLATFEAGRPELDLIERGKPWFIPLDVAKLMRAEPGLVESVHFRPSQFNTLQANFYKASQAVRDDSISILNQGVTSSEMVGANQAMTLDIALAMLEYQRNQKSSEAEAASLNQQQLQLANLRSKVDAPSDYKNAPRPAASPDEGHDSFRAGLAYGRVGSVNYAQLNLRGGYHDELDPESGFALGSRSKMFDLYLRLNDQQVRFERLDLFDVFTPSVRTEWFSQPTIKFNLGLRRDVLNNDQLSPLALRMEAGAGSSYRWGESARAYILANSVTRISGANSSLAGGPEAGIIWSITPKIRMEANGSALWYALGEPRQNWIYSAGGGLAWDIVNPQNNVRLNLMRQLSSQSSDDNRNFGDVQLAYFHYF